MDQTQHNILPDFHVIIAAAGSGQRANSDLPKQYMPINGTPTLLHNIKKFHNLPQCRSIRVIIDPTHAELFHDVAKGLNKVSFSHGGKERNASINNALNDIHDIKDEEIILIHDAARPCISTTDIQTLLKALKHTRAATLAIPVSSTLRLSDKEKNADQSISRENLWELQTPQGFRYGDLLNAHKQASPEKEYTDDTSLVSEIGIPVKFVQGSASNIKITHPQDFEMAEKLLNTNTIFLTGQGFDVHVFDQEKTGPVRICGIDIDHNAALKGHSDADVGLHALTDAILGAIAQGDIGQHFPPSNDDFKDMDSSIFLKKALTLMSADQFNLVNIDMTLICEEPKIGPHTTKMRARIAELTGLNISRINIKATTTEQLGFTGRKEGIAAQALVTISRNDEASL